MKNLKHLRTKQKIDLLNRLELKRALSYKKFQDYKQKNKKNQAMKKFLLLDKFVCKLHNRIMKYIPDDCILCDDSFILKKGSIPNWNRYTVCKFY